MITVLCYKKCTTCQKAFKWLDENGVEYKERAIKEENPTYEELKTWYEKSGLPLKKFFNTSGMLYKELGLKDKLLELPKEVSVFSLFALGYPAESRAQEDRFHPERIHFLE